MSPPALLGRRRPPALALVVVAVLGCASALAAAPGGPGGRPLGILEVSAGRAPSFGLVPVSRRDEAVLRSQPELQILGVGTTLARAKLARLHRGGDADRWPGRPSGTATARLRAPPSPA